MKNKICAMLAAVLLMLGMMPTVSMAANDPVIFFTVTADKEEAVPGDVIEFSVWIRAQEDCTGFQMDLDVPEGMTYVENSGKVEPSFRLLTGADGDVSFTEVTKRILGGTTVPFKNITEDRLLATFQCKVNEDAKKGDYVVDLTRREVLNGNYDIRDASEYSYIPVEITVKKASKPAENTQESKPAENQTTESAPATPDKQEPVATKEPQAVVESKPAEDQTTESSQESKPAEGATSESQSVSTESSAAQENVSTQSSETPEGKEEPSADQPAAAEPAEKKGNSWAWIAALLAVGCGGAGVGVYHSKKKNREE